MVAEDATDVNDDGTELPSFGREVHDCANSEVKSDQPMRQIKTVFNIKSATNQNKEYSPKEIKATKQPAAAESKSKSVVVDQDSKEQPDETTAITKMKSMDQEKKGLSRSPSQDHGESRTELKLTGTDSKSPSPGSVKHSPTASDDKQQQKNQAKPSASPAKGSPASPQSNSSQSGDSPKTSHQDKTSQSDTNSDSHLITITERTYEESHTEANTSQVSVSQMLMDDLKQMFKKTAGAQKYQVSPNDQKGNTRSPGAAAGEKGARANDAQAKRIAAGSKTLIQAQRMRQEEFDDIEEAPSK